MLSRRHFLRLGIGGLGLSLPHFLQRSACAGEGFGRARSCIVLYCWGGMSHRETFDLKPNAPAEYRGEFQPIRTAVPGILVGEHLPLMARQTDKLAIIRSIHHKS